MRQQSFEDRNREHWEQLSQMLTSKDVEHIEKLPYLYRQVCHDLALAKQRRYTPDLIEHLNQLVMRGHHRLYRKTARYRYRWTHFLLIGFAQVLRRNASFVYLSLALFCLPALVLGTLCYYDEEMIYSVMSYGQVQGLENMYDPDAKVIGRERESDTDLMMFGYYIKHNIGIGFRMFAGGVIFGVGALFFIVFNGVFLGSVAGHLTQLKFSQTFYPFVIGHGAFELTAIVFCGAAGLMLGYALISPGQYRRVVALKMAAKDAIKIMYGATLMLIIAAFLEAFWSSSTVIPADVKLAVGTGLWIIVISYCVFSGRGVMSGSQSH